MRSKWPLAQSPYSDWSIRVTFSIYLSRRVRILLRPRLSPTSFPFWGKRITIWSLFASAIPHNTDENNSPVDFIPENRYLCKDGFWGRVRQKLVSGRPRSELRRPRKLQFTMREFIWICRYLYKLHSERNTFPNMDACVVDTRSSYYLLV